MAEDSQKPQDSDKMYLSCITLFRGDFTLEKGPESMDAELLEAVRRPGGDEAFGRFHPAGASLHEQVRK